MDLGDLAGRVRLRYLPGEHVPDGDVIEEMVRTVIDRLTIRMDADGSLPDAAGSIVVDAAMKALRLRGFEGSTSESAADGGSVSNSFIDDILSAYSADLDALRRMIHRSGIRFMGGRPRHAGHPRRRSR
ncbi:hypothetical protein EII22_08985 [Coriobacteriales bacterium OH1046]|nr:hypothetical protein EII22_08985 [Coriobacteriales bacterium OH1046]